MPDAVIISDIHLGSDNCQAKRLCSFLEQLVTNQVVTDRLILNGDVFDSIDFRRLHKNHWKVLSLIRKLSDHLEIIWLCGNHDGSAEIISHLLGVIVADEFILESGHKRILVLHGHIFDRFLAEHPLLTILGDTAYWLLQRLDKTHNFAKLAKRGSKTFLRCAQQIQDKAVDYAASLGCDAVCCGHTHHPDAVPGRVSYYNSGCWTESPGTYVVVDRGNVELLTFDGSLQAPVRCSSS